MNKMSKSKKELKSRESYVSHAQRNAIVNSKYPCSPDILNLSYVDAPLSAKVDKAFSLLLTQDKDIPTVLSLIDGIETRLKIEEIRLNKGGLFSDKVWDTLTKTINGFC